MAVIEQKLTMKDFERAKPTWCPGCGDFGVLRGVQTALANLNIEPHNVVCVSGIGCSGKFSQYLNSYGFHGIHGRALPIATGVKMANRDLTVIAAGGDGDGYGIGIGHLMHAIRRNIDITYIVMDNHIYGLTVGQASPTSDKGHVTRTSPFGTVEDPIRPLQTVLAAGIGFIAQGFSGDVKGLSRMIEAAIQHNGFAMVNVFSPCVTFNKLNTYDYYRERLVNLDDDPDYDPTDRVQAIAKVIEHNGLVTGIIYREERPSLQDGIKGYAKEPLATGNLQISEELFNELLAAHM